MTIGQLLRWLFEHDKAPPFGDISAPHPITGSVAAHQQRLDELHQAGPLQFNAALHQLNTARSIDESALDDAWVQIAYSYYWGKLSKKETSRLWDRYENLRADLKSPADIVGEMPTDAFINSSIWRYVESPALGERIVIAGEKANPPAGSEVVWQGRELKLIAAATDVAEVQQLNLLKKVFDGELIGDD